MKFWIKCSRDGLDNYSYAEGMDQETATNLLLARGATNIQIITKDVFDSHIATQDI